jgi:chromosome segregation ATPase
MQKLVDHRDVLRTKGQAVQNATKDGHRGVTKITVNRDNARLAKELNEKKQDAQTKEKQIKDCLANTEHTAQEVEKVVQEINTMQSNIAELQHRLDVLNQERSRISEEKTRKQRSLQRFRDAEKGLYKLSTYPEAVAEEQHKLDVKKRTLAVVMQELVEHFPQMQDELQDLTSAL